MFDLSHLPGISLSFGISRRNCPLWSGGRSNRERRKCDQHTELGRLISLHTGQAKMVLKLYKVNKREIVPLLPVQCHFRIGGLFLNGFLHKNLAESDWSCSEFVD